MMLSDFTPEEQRLMQHMTCALSTTRGRGVLAGTRISPQAQWDTAIAEALVECNGNRQRAFALVGRKHPQLRASLVASANGGRSVGRVVAKAVAKPVARGRAASDLEELVSDLMSQGLDRSAAVRQAYKNCPGLREQMIDDANAARQQSKRGLW